MARLCPSLPLLALTILSGCCCSEPPYRPTPYPYPYDVGPVPDARFVYPDAGRPDGGAPDAPPPILACSIAIVDGALCDDEPCIAPAREVTCPGGLQNLSVAATDDGTTWLAAGTPPRLLHTDGTVIEERDLPFDGEGTAHLFVDSSGAPWALFSDVELAIAPIGDPSSVVRTPLLSDRAYWVVLGAQVDDAGDLHVAWIDETPGVHAGLAPLADPTLFVEREVSPRYFADTAVTLGADGVEHVAYWEHRTPADLGRDLVVRDGEGAPHAIGFVAEPNDDGTNVSIAATATALLAAMDFADGIHLLVPDDTVEETAYRDAVVPGTGGIVTGGCVAPSLDACHSLTCTESGTGSLRGAHELVELGDGRFALLWVERSMERTLLYDTVCGEPGCACVATPLEESGSSQLVLGIVDPLSGMPARTLVVPVGDVVTNRLAVARRGSRLVVTMQSFRLTAVLVDVELSFFAP